MGKVETSIQSAIYKSLSKIPYIVVTRHNTAKPGYHKSWRAAKAESGFGDLICCILGRYVEMEVKTDAGSQQASQIEHARMVEKAGGSYHVVRSEKDAMEVVQRIMLRYKEEQG